MIAGIRPLLLSRRAMQSSRKRISRPFGPGPRGLAEAPNLVGRRNRALQENPDLRLGPPNFFRKNPPAALEPYQIAGRSSLFFAFFAASGQSSPLEPKDMPTGLLRLAQVRAVGPPLGLLGNMLHKTKEKGKGRPVPIEREMFAEIRALDEYDLRRLAIFVKGLLLQRGDLGPQADERPEDGKVGYRQQSVNCGKRGCKTCPHGPYWYAYWREGGRLRSRYIGKSLPEGAG